VGHSQHEYFVLAPLECDDVRKALENRSPDQWHCGSCARPFRKRIGSFAYSIEGSSYHGNELVAQTNAPLFMPSAALRSSALASGCSSTRTPLLEFLQDRGPDGPPGSRMNATLRNFLGAPFQLGGPRSSDFFVGLFQAGKQFLGDLSAFGARKTQCFGKQLVSRHDTSLTPRVHCVRYN
jgi:hypothetical protein